MSVKARRAQQASFSSQADNSEKLADPNGHVFLTAYGKTRTASRRFIRYDHKGHKIVLVIDGNSGGVINSIGL